MSFLIKNILQPARRLEHNRGTKKTLQHKEIIQPVGMSSTCVIENRSDGPDTNYKLTIAAYQSNGDWQNGNIRFLSQVITPQNNSK